jgi:hypothetical protein
MRDLLLASVAGSRDLHKRHTNAPRSGAYPDAMRERPLIAVVEDDTAIARAVRARLVAEGFPTSSSSI